MQMHKSIFSTIAAIGLASSVAAIGLVSSVVASDHILTQNTIQLQSDFYGNDVQLTVTGPDGFNFTKKGVTLVSLSEMKAQKDGQYRFEFVEINVLGEQQVTDNFNGRGQATQKIVESIVEAGHFRIKNGAIISIQLVESN